jgi:L-seryl-tRNA(Ser) seleniumtransferase
VLAAAAEAPEAVRERAERLAELLGGDVVATTARVGGGAVPLLELASFACALDGGDALAAALRAGDPPVVALVREGRVLLDCRTLTDEQCLQITL